MQQDVLRKKMEQQLDARRTNGSLRRLRNTGSIETGKLHEFSSNDYLDLSTSPTLRALFTLYMEQQPSLASTGSRLLSGNSSLAEVIEREASVFWQSQSSILCASGYEANVSIFGTLPQVGDTVIYDELIHASVHVGLKSSRASSKVPFRHNDLEQLRRLLRHEGRKCKSHSVFLAIETVYSMDGDVAPLGEIIQIIRRVCPRTHLILDEAHATGVFGPRGEGLATAMNLQNSPEILIRLHTFGKGSAGTGAIILCDDDLVKQYLLNYAKGLIYSTFMSVPALCLTRASLTMLSSAQTVAPCAALWRRIAYTQSLLSTLPRSPLIELPDSIDSAIVPILSTRAVELSAYLEQHGFRVMPVRYPTVAKGRERIRLCLRSGVEYSVIDRLVAAIGDWATSAQDACPDQNETNPQRSSHLLSSNSKL